MTGIKQLTKRNLLIIDDFLLHSITDEREVKVLFEIMEKRSELNNSTIVCSQRDPKNWTAMINMTRFPKKMTENGIHYTLHGDYFFPDLGLSESPRQAIGRYGRMRKAYLEEHHPGLYTRLILSGKLYDHLAETDQVCRDRMERMIARMAEGINEELKASDQLTWVGRMNSIRQQAEEIILQELIYA